MCRWLAYSGSPVLLEELLVKPAHSLIDQSKHSRLGATTLNGDGFGVGWYGAPDTPGVFHGTEPAWNDRNLRDIAAHISSPLIFAHIRASTGTAVQETNCHPFRHKQLALDAQRRDSRLPARQARPRARGRPLALPADRRIDRLGAVLLPRAHARARGQPAARRRAGRRPDRGDGPTPRRRAPDPDDGGDDGRRRASGRSATRANATRDRCSSAPRCRRCATSTPTTPCSTASPTRRASCSRSRSATSPARGTRCRSRAGASSSRGRTSCTRSRRAILAERYVIRVGAVLGRRSATRRIRDASGMSSAAPTRKPSAPRNVPPFATPRVEQLARRGDDVRADRREAEEDRAGQVEGGDQPAEVIAAPRDPAVPCLGEREPAGDEEADRAERVGRQERRLADESSRLSIIARKVLMLKKTVPTSWIEVASQSIRRGSHDARRTACERGRLRRSGVHDLEVLERRGAREEDRADEERDAVCPAPTSDM